MPYKGQLAPFVYQLVGGLRAGMGYCGTQDLEELRTRARFIQVTAASVQESHPHDIAHHAGSAELLVPRGVRQVGRHVASCWPPPAWPWPGGGRPGRRAGLQLPPADRRPRARRPRLVLPVQARAPAAHGTTPGTTPGTHRPRHEHAGDHPAGQDPTPPGTVPPRTAAGHHPGRRRCRAGRGRRTGRERAGPGAGTRNGEDPYKAYIRLEPPGRERLFGSRDTEHELEERMRQERRDTRPGRPDPVPGEAEADRQGVRDPAVRPDGRAGRAELRGLPPAVLRGEELGARTGGTSGRSSRSSRRCASSRTRCCCRTTSRRYPCRRFDTNAGQCQPGDPVPYILYPPEFTGTGLLAEVGAVALLFLGHPVRGSSPQRAQRTQGKGRGKQKQGWAGGSNLPVPNPASGFPRSSSLCPLCPLW